MNVVEFIIDEALVDYQYAVDFMQKRVCDIIEERAHQMIWLLEHNHVYTIGRNTREEEYRLIQQEQNKYSNIIQTPSVYLSDRGGQVTYHGPGQIVLYFMLDMQKMYNQIDVKRFVYDLEEVVIVTLKSLGVSCFRHNGMHGVWVNIQNMSNNKKAYITNCSNKSIKKIAALGLKFKKSVSYHGIALNLTTDLEYYKKISPCGMSSTSVTSLHANNIFISSSVVKNELIKSISDVFDMLSIQCSIKRQWG